MLPCRTKYSCEVRLILSWLEVGGVREFADLLIDRPLPGGQPVDIGVDVRVGVPARRAPATAWLTPSVGRGSSWPVLGARWAR
jgi:hypothetical protein